jgi:hypothetical protein
MKFVSVVLILIISASIASGMDLLAKKRMITKIITECKAQTDASDSDIVNLMMEKEPETKEAKCLFACFLEHMHFVKDGKIDRESVIAKALAIKLPEGAVDKIIDDCENAGAGIEDACESAAKIGFCAKQSMDEQVKVAI